MGFWFVEEKKKKATKKTKKQDLSKIPKNLLKEQGCRVCSLGKESALPAKGDDKPLIYILGEMPGNNDIDSGIHFKGEYGSMVRKALKNAFPDLFLSNKSLTKTVEIRYNYCVQCPTESYRPPMESEIECCRKSIEEDIQKAKPFAIIGLGPISLKWMIGLNNIDEWRGRKLPVKIGDHTCWYFPIQTPTLLRIDSKKKFKNEYEKAFDMDFMKAAKFIMNPDSPDAKVYDKDFDKGVKIYEGISSKEIKEIKKALDKMIHEPSLGIDIETDRLKPYGAKDAKILTIAIGTFKNTIAFPVDHPKAWRGDNKSRKEIKSILETFLLECRAFKACHNTKFELLWSLHSYNQRVLRAGKWADTMAQAYTIDNRTKKHGGMLSLNILCLLHFGFQLKPLTDIDVKNIIKEPLDKVLRYNAMDTKWTHLLFQVQEKLLEESQVWTYEHLVRTAITLAVTESDGLPLDFEKIEEFSDKYSEQLKDIEEKISKLKSVKKYNRKYGEFNPASPDNVVLLFKEILELKSTKGTGKKKDGYSTDEEVLKGFSEKGYKEADLILSFREISKVKGTYLDSLDKVIYPDNMLHPDFNHLFTSTGRFSSENPNVQNFPKHRNKEIRSIVVPTEKHWLVAVDYGQLEARIIAMASQDKTFCEAIETGYDIHMEWAERIAKVHPNILDSVNNSMKDLRQRAKNEWVFPLFFGSHFMSVSSSLGLPPNKGDKLVKEFWDVFKGVRKWQDKINKFYDKHGYVETLTGARRQGPLSYNEMINAPIQGTASYIVVDAKNRLSEYAYEKRKPQFQARINVHDDLTFFLPEKSLEGDMDIIAKYMSCTPFDFVNIPLAVEISVGENWADLEEVLVTDTTDFK